MFRQHSARNVSRTALGYKLNVFVRALNTRQILHALLELIMITLSLNNIVRPNASYSCTYDTCEIEVVDYAIELKL